MIDNWRKMAGLWASALLLLIPAYASHAQDAAQPGDRFAFTQDYTPKPAVWRVADEDTTIYLMGTIHLLPEGFEWRNPELDAIIASADELVVETLDSDADLELLSQSGKIDTIYSGNFRISEELPKQLRGKWQKFAEQLPASYHSIDRTPILLAMLNYMMAGDPNDPSSYAYGVETILEAEFQATDRPISSIENFWDILLSMYRRSDRQAIRDLASELESWDGKGPLFPGLEIDEESDFWEMEHMWARGELDNDFDLGFGDGKLGARFRKIILEDRNRAWAGWLERRLDEPGTVLVAVGAGHFEGHDSVQVMLEERGVAFERVQ